MVHDGKTTEPAETCAPAAAAWSSWLWCRCSAATAVLCFARVKECKCGWKHCWPAGTALPQLHTDSALLHLSMDTLMGTCQAGLWGNKDQPYFIWCFLWLQVEINTMLRVILPLNTDSSHSVEGTTRTNPPPSLGSTILSIYSLFSSLLQCSQPKYFRIQFCVLKIR